MIVPNISKVSCDIFIHWKFDKNPDLKTENFQYTWLSINIILIVDWLKQTDLENGEWEMSNTKNV